MSLRSGTDCSVEYINSLHTAHNVKLYVVIFIVIVAVFLTLVINDKGRHRY